MLNYLRALVARFHQRGRGWFLPPAADPYAGVRVPRPHPPDGRSSAVAVEEPRPDTFVNAHGGAARGPHRP